MPYCPVCFTSYAVDTTACWPCRRRLLPGEVSEGVGASVGASETASEDARWTALCPVYEAPDELSALRVQAVLEEIDISAVVVSAQIPWIGSVMQNINGYWGKVLVHPLDQEIASELVLEYLESLEA